MTPPEAEMQADRRETIRIHQANERTLLAWLRTGIALMAFGFAIARFGVFLRSVQLLGNTTPAAAEPIGSVWVGVLLVAAGMIASAASTTRFWRIRAAVQRGEVGAPSAAMAYIFGVLISLVGLAMALLLLHAL